MGATDNLYALIKSLTPAEKRHFQLYSRMYSTGNADTFAYLKLYEHLARLKEYNEEDIRSYCQKKGITKNFAAEKNTLYKRLLKSLRVLHATDLEDSMRDVANLYHKGLYEAMRKKHRALRKQVVTNGLIVHHFNLLLFERDVLSEGKGQQLERSVKEVFDEIEQLGPILNTYSSLSRLKNLMLELVKKTPHPVNSKNQKKAESLKREANNIYSKSGQSPLCSKEYFTFFAYYHFFNGEFEQSRNFWLKAIELFHQYELWPVVFSKEYRKQLSNFLGASLAANIFKDFSPYLTKLKNIPVGSAIEQAEAFQHYHHLQLIYLLQTCQFEEAKKLASIILNALPTYKPFINPNRYLTILSNLGLLNFVAANKKEAVACFQKMVDERVWARLDLQVKARFLLLLLNFDEMTYEQLQLRIKTFLQYLRARKEIEGKQEEYKTVLLELLMLKADSRYPILEKVLNNEYSTHTFPGKEWMIIWLKSRTEKRSVEGVFKELYG